MPSRVGYQSTHELLKGVYRALRIPIVFVMSAFGSYCAVQGGGALFGQNGNLAARGAGQERVVLWNADLLPDGTLLRAREGTLGTFARSVNPDVLVLYNVPAFSDLLKLRNALGLYGYTAVMSNFFCKPVADGPRWPIEIAVLSRYPISEAIEFDPPTDQLDGCSTPGPFTDGPVVASRQKFTVPAGHGLHWPVLAGSTRDRPLPGPGFLIVRIDSARVVIAGVRVALASEYPDVAPSAINAMRQAITASLGDRIWHERYVREDDHFLAMGDFGVDPGVHLPNGELVNGNADNEFDGVDTILTQGVIGGGKAMLPRSDYTLGGLRMINLTRALVVQTVKPAATPHSGRIYLWSHLPGVFGLAQRVERAYGSHSFPLAVASSGGTCAIDPLLTWMRRGATFAGLSKQVFTASRTALAVQLKAWSVAKARGPWVVSLDLENVLIDNSPFLYEMARKCQLPSEADWDRWIASGRAGLLPGAAQFIKTVRKHAAGGRGRILIFTKRRPQQRAQTMSLLVKLGLATGPNDPMVAVEYAATVKSREAAWHRVTARGQRTRARGRQRHRAIPL